MLGKMFWIMLDIALLKKDNIIKSTLARKLNISPTEPLFNKTLKILEENDIINYINGETLNSKKVLINFKKIEDFIKKQEEFIKIEDFIHKYNPVAIT